MKLASTKGLYDYNNKNDVSKIQEFCESNGYCLQELKFDEVNPILDLLQKYESKEEVIVDTEFKELTDLEEQVTLEV